MTTTNTIIGIGELRVLRAGDGVLTTHALGSCIGVTVFDPKAGVCGMLHYMLPQPTRKEPVSEDKVATYATTGLPLLFTQAYELGARKEDMVVCAAGAANLLEDTANFQIGKRNHTMLRKLFWKNNITVAAEQIGGSQARTMRLDMRSGSASVLTKGQETFLWQP